jgi:hypothetical protein
VTIELSIAPAQQAHPVGVRLRWRGRRRERQRLARQDRLAAHLAGLHRIRALISEARAVIELGWVQHGWFAYRDAQGGQHTVNAGNLRRVDDLPVTGGLPGRRDRACRRRTGGGRLTARAAGST